MSEPATVAYHHAMCEALAELINDTLDEEYVTTEDLLDHLASMGACLVADDGRAFAAYQFSTWGTLVKRTEA